MILAIDPGPVTSGVVFFNDRENTVQWADAAMPNHKVLQALDEIGRQADQVVCEMIASYGMPVGAEVFETCVWIGRFWQAALVAELPFDRLFRLAVKQHLCHDSRAKDSNIAQALCDRFGGGKPGSGAAKGTKKAPGPLHGVSGDAWAALAVALTWSDTHP